MSKSCDTCLRVNSSGNCKAKMVERKIVSVPFETVAVDLGGPVPKAKRGDSLPSGKSPIGMLASPLQFSLWERCGWPT